MEQLKKNKKEVGNKLSDFEIIKELGKGSYGTVYTIKSLLNSQIYVMKKMDINHLKPNQQQECHREVSILKKVSHPNIIKYYSSFIEQEILYIIMEYAELGDLYSLIKHYKKHGKYFNELDLWKITSEILSGLEYLHSKKIIHRDIKSGNIVVNSITKELNVIDWGLSEYYVENYKYCTRVGTRYYKAPELLLDYKKYDYAIDLWSVGCIFGAILFQKDFLFKGEDINDQLVKIANVFGFQEIENYLNKYKNETKISQKSLDQIKNYTKKEWTSFINQNNKYLINDEALDLLDKLLKFDHEERINAKDALNHPYFKDLDEKYK